MELSFTQGRWNYECWGSYDPISSSNAKPPGVELWAVFDVPEDEIDATWRNLTHALSGLFCASINFLESSTTYSSPEWGFLQFSANLRYGSLPREAVCTENLTLWLKLLPCRDKAGLSTLMDRPSIYRGFYHSQHLCLTSTEFNATDLNTGTVVEQTLTLVLQPRMVESNSAFSGVSTLQPSWSLSSLFGRKVYGKCAVAKSSNVYLQLEALVSEMEDAPKEDGRDDIGKLAVEGSLSHPGFEISVSPHRVLKELHEKGSILYEFLVDKYSDSMPFDLGFKWSLPMVWSCSQAPLHTSRFLMGSGNERGAIALSLKPTQQSEVSQTGDINGDIRSLQGFLHIDQYPPDANQGFDIPSAVVSFPDFQTSLNFFEDAASNKSPMLSKLQEKSPVLTHTELLLVPLTTPDFSMPYNVITITCTVCALYFGSLLNSLRRRIGEEERFLKRQSC